MGVQVPRTTFKKSYWFPTGPHLAGKTRFWTLSFSRPLDRTNEQASKAKAFGSHARNSKSQERSQAQPGSSRQGVKID